MKSRFHCRMRTSPEENMRRIAPTIAGTVSSGKKAQAAVPVMSVSFFARSVKKLKNGWVDEEGKVYIYFTRQSVMEALDCGNKKAGQLFAELDDKNGIGLITRTRQGTENTKLLFF